MSVFHYSYVVKVQQVALTLYSSKVQSSAQVTVYTGFPMVSLCPCGFPLGSMVFSHLPKAFWIS